MQINSNLSINLNNLMRMSEKEISQATERLTTGYRINQASDDSSGLQISERLTAQINGDQMALRNIDQGISLIDTADQGLATVLEILVRTKELLIQANNGTNSTLDIKSIQNEITQNLDAVDQIINTTYFNGIKVLNSTELNSGGVLSNTLESSNTSVATVDQLFTNNNWQHTLTVSQLADEMEVTSDTVADSTTSLGLTGQFKINSTVFTIDNAMSLDNIKDSINNKNIGVTASIDNNKLVITAKATGEIGEFTASDLSSDGNQFGTSTPSVVTTVNLISNEEWSHTVEVSKLAQSMEVSGDSFANTTSPLGISGDFKIENTIFTINDSMSLTDIKDLVNDANLSVEAKINSNKLYFVSKTTGAASAFSAQDLTTNNNTTTSSNPSVVTIDSLLSPSDWTYSLDVQSLAKEQIVQGDAIADSTNPLNVIGTFKINSTTFDISNTMSLVDIKDMINASNIGISASIDPSNKLTLSSSTTGTANAFTADDITNEGNSFTSTNPTVVTTDTLVSNTEWDHTVEVTQLAGTMEVQGKVVSDINQSLGLTGDFELEGTIFSVTDTMSLNHIKTLINDANISVTASIDTGNKLHITSKVAGTSGVFTAQDLLTGGTAGVFSSTDTSVANTDTLISNTDWNHTVEVTQLAETMEVQSDVVSDINLSLGLDGEFTLAGQNFTITNNMTLNDIKISINNAGIGVTAIIDASKRLHLVSSTSGSAGTFTAQDLIKSGIPDIFSSSNTSVATTDTLISDTDWSNEIVVGQLAGTMEVQSQSVTDINQTLGLKGQFKLNNTVFDVTDTMSLNDIKTMINNTSIGITASIDANKKLHLISDTSGSGGVFVAQDLVTSGNTTSIFSSSNINVSSTDTLILDTDWTHNLEVTQLASGFSVGGDTQISEITALGFKGQFKIDTDIFDVTTDMSLTNIRDMINTDSGTVIASISNKQLILTSKETGAAATFNAEDLTKPGYSSSNKSVASPDTLIVNSDWSHEVKVINVATKSDNWVVERNDTFSTNTLSQYTVNGGSWSVSGGNMVQAATSGNNRLDINGSNGLPVLRKVEGNFRITRNGGSAGLYLSYVDANNYVRGVYSDTAEEARLEVMSGGTLSSQVIFSGNVARNIDYRLSIEYQGNGKFYVEANNGTGTNYFGPIEFGVFVGDVGYPGSGQAGMFATSGSASFADVTLSANYQTTNNAVYEVDGVQYTSSTNENVSLKNSSGTELAKFNIAGPGTTTLTNSSDNSILQDLGILKPLPYQYEVVNDDFSTNSLSNYQAGGSGAAGTWSVSNGHADYNGKDGWVENILLNKDTIGGPTPTFVETKFKMSWSSTGNEPIGGVVLSNGGPGGSYSFAYIDEYYNELALYVAGTAVTVPVQIDGNKEYILNLSTDGNNNFTANVLDGVTRSLLATKTVFVPTARHNGASGSGIISNSPSSFDYFKMESMADDYLVGSDKYKNQLATGTDAIYKVDGVTKTSNTNDNILLEDGVGTDQAFIDLTGTGTTTVSNVKSVSPPSDEILQTLSLIDASNNFMDYISNGQDASYTVNGTNFTSNTNDNILLKSTSGTDQALIDIKGLGSTTISNQVGTANSDEILKTLNILNSGGTFQNYVKSAQDALYKVDGTDYSNGTNENILLESIGGVDQAIVDLKGIGTTIIKNTVGTGSSDEILKELSILNSTGSFMDYVNYGEDAIYKIDGVSYTGTSNDNILLEGIDGTDHATIDLKAIGTSIVKNGVTNEILKRLGILDASGLSFKNLAQLAQDLSYSFDGNSYTTSKNDDIVLKSSDGTNRVQVDMKSVGSSILENISGQAILDHLGILTDAGLFQTIVKQAQDTEYKVNGIQFTDIDNQVRIGNNAGTDHADILLNKTGTAQVYNKTTDAILKQLGLLDNLGDFKNVNTEGIDSKYTIDGTDFTSSKNDNINIGMDVSVDLKGIGTSIIQNTVVMDPNVDSFVPTGINIHNGYGDTQANELKLSELNTNTLGIDPLRNSLNSGLEKVDNAINTVLQERGRYGAERNRLEFNKEYVSNRKINLQNARKNIEETDFAKETSRLMQNEILQDVMKRMHQITFQQQKNVLTLLNG
ncbi:hypothetical protein MZM54_02080 [[Brevibacterium] frigoritolerans]|nr:hypothetical protein [Peribacillus frigoritolerans]